MSHQIRFSKAARDDIERLYRFLADQDLRAAEAALLAFGKAWELMGNFPFTARKPDPVNPLLRELVIPFGGAGYVALFEITDADTLTVLAVRHQCEDDYH